MPGAGRGGNLWATPGAQRRSKAHMAHAKRSRESKSTHLGAATRAAQWTIGGRHRRCGPVVAMLARGDPKRALLARRCATASREVTFAIEVERGETTLALDDVTNAPRRDVRVLRLLVTDETSRPGQVLMEASKGCFVPLTVGGGVRSDRKSVV